MAKMGKNNFCVKFIHAVDIVTPLPIVLPPKGAYLLVTDWTH